MRHVAMFQEHGQGALANGAKPHEQHILIKVHHLEILRARQKRPYPVRLDGEPDWKQTSKHPVLPDPFELARR